MDTIPGGGVRVANPATGVWTPDTRWHLVQELRMGTLEGDGPELFGEVADIAVDAEGRIHVLEAQSHELRVFGPDGTHLRTVGGEGSGPGELNIPFGGEVFLHPDGRIWINNAMNRRWELFSPSGAALGSTPHHSTFFGGTTVLGRDGALYQQDRVEDATGERRAVLVRKAVRGDSLVPTDTLEVPALPDEEVVEVSATTGSGGRMSMRLPVPFVHQPSWRWDPRGFFWVEPGTGYRLVQLSPEGDTLRIVERAYDPVPVTEAEVEEAMSTFTQGPLASSDGHLDRSRIPDDHPAFDTFRTDRRGTLWVRRTLGGDEWAWDVFDPEGIYLGEVAGDVGFDRLVIHEITDDAVYGVLRDELDVPYVVRLAIREGEPAG